MVVENTETHPRVVEYSGDIALSSYSRKQNGSRHTFGEVLVCSREPTNAADSK